jgi:hypothetical protein
MNLIKCLSHIKWGAYQKILNDSSQHTQIRRESRRQSSVILEPTHNRGLKLTLGLFVICQVQPTYPGQNAGIEEREEDNLNHHKSKTPHSTLLR